MAAVAAAYYLVGIFCLAICGSASPRRGSTSVIVPLLDLRIQASANCCPVNSADANCIEEQCPIADQLLNAADEDALTELLVDFISEDSENGPQVQYSFYLEQVHYSYKFSINNNNRLVIIFNRFTIYLR